MKKYFENDQDMSLNCFHEDFFGLLIGYFGS
jgi:hypothetical protein